MIFQVTQKHIDRGARCLADSCPIALAILEKLPYSRPNVDRAGIIISDRYYQTPYAVAKFIQHFDARASYGVRPFEFEIELVVPREAA